jgi:hypothetical protein
LILDPLEHLHEILRGDRGIDFDVQRLPIEVIHDIESQEALAISVGIHLDVASVPRAIARSRSEISCRREQIKCSEVDRDDL